MYDIEHPDITYTRETGYPYKVSRVYRECDVCGEKFVGRYICIHQKNVCWDCVKLYSKYTEDDEYDD